MITFKEYLAEVFDSPFIWKQVSNSKFEKIYRVNDSDKIIDIIFEFKYKKINSKSSVDFITISFDVNDDKESITNEFGSRSIKIFSTILDIIKSKNYIKYPLKFESDINQPTRVKLYRVISKKLSTLLNKKSVETRDQQQQVFLIK